MSDSDAGQGLPESMGTEPEGGRTSYDIHGYAVTVDVPEPAAARLVGSILCEFAIAAHPDAACVVAYELRRIGESWRVAGPGSATYRTESLADAMLALEWQLVTDDDRPPSRGPFPPPRRRAAVPRPYRRRDGSRRRVRERERRP